MAPTCAGTVGTRAGRERSAAPRTVRVVMDGAATRRSSVAIFDDPANAVHALPSADVMTIAPRSIALLEM